MVLDDGSGKASASPGASASPTQDPEAAMANSYAGGYGAAGAATGTGTAGHVYMGYQQQLGERNLPRVDITMSKAQAYQFINGLGGKQLSDLQAKMVYSGLIKDGDGIMEMQAKWKKLVDASYGLFQAGQKITPMDVLDSYLGKGPLGGKGPATASLWQVQYRGGRKFLVNSQTGEVKYEGPKFETTYNKSIDLTDPTTAKAIATSVFQQLMHRDPGKGELAGYGSALHQAEQQSPTITNTTTEYDPNTGEAIGQSSSQSGGFGADAKQYLAEQRVKGTKEYASTQAATTYTNAIEAAIFNNPFGSI